ncbi:MAG: ferrous iron transport protein A [Christensenellaceae bacterium]
MPLVIAPTDRTVDVVKIFTDDRTKKHLESLGITHGAKIKVLSRDEKGVVLLVKDGRLALDGALARKILVA